jgi:outer membrane protein
MRAAPRADGRALLRAAVALAVATLASCAHVDASHDADAYRRLLDASVAPLGDIGKDAPLTLERAMAMANAHDERLGQSGEAYVQALIAKDRAFGAFLPTVGFRPSFTIGDAPPGTGSRSGGGLGALLVHRGDTLQGLDAPVSGHMNVFRGYGDVANVKAAEAVIAERRDLLLDLQADVMLDVARTYYLVLRAERGVDVLRESLKLQEARLADVEQQLAHGLATRLTVAQTRAQVDAVRVQLTAASSDVTNGRTTLAFLVGVPSAPNPLVDSFAVPDAIGDEAGYERDAVTTRDDILAAHHAMEAARHEIDAAMAQYYPSVSIDVTGFLRREAFADASKWNALLSMNLPILSAGQIEADVRTAWSHLREAALEESAVRRGALHDVRTAYEDTESSRRRIADLDDEVRAAEEALVQAQSAFANGLGINLDVLGAEDDVLRAKLGIASARFDRTVAYLDLLRASGRLLPPPGAPLGTPRPPR